ncbi:MAG TPA: flagellar biosynthesis repressor FlbT [Stellaceae bacterium]|nr:flagellar biosynthesis repressor FlbT [Stellaceae bacterium]
MPLTINLKPREKLILNGVVIENSGPMAKILIHTNAALLREKDVLPEEKATTPARRIYFAIQCQYLFAGKAEMFLASIDRQLAEYEQACPESHALLGEIRRLLAEGQFYRALKAAKLLIQHEEEAAAASAATAGAKPTIA